ncbi:hypothetical protein M407DRAFT_222812 [Tulasnella calospora MUT 4182]|uniref:Uncharacterized protein n=1 Tax=Tulasnella calospora MUT 4182 TaxID=1051891 RepID=A0A0C3PWP9_9AGAM|nr:hypothetical protein M407DRAFT_222812 [Tulasnella calospora MUT 4182]
MTSNPEDQIIVAQNVCSLEPAVASGILLHDPMAWRRLLGLTQDALRLWHDCPTTINKRTAELFGAAVCYLLLQQPEHGDKWQQVRSTFPTDVFWRPELPSWLALDALEFSITGKVPKRTRGVILIGTEQSLNKMVLRKVILGFGHATSRSLGWADLVRLVRIPHDDTILSLVALYIRQIAQFVDDEAQWTLGMLERGDPRTQALASDEYLAEKVGLNIANALWAWDKLAKVVTDPTKVSHMAEIYLSFMRKIEDLASRIQADWALVRYLRQGLQKIVFGIGRRTSRDSVTYVRFVLGTISLSKTLHLDDDNLDPMAEMGLWKALDYVAGVAHDNSEISRNLGLEDFMIKTLAWVASSFQTQAEIQSLPNFVTFLASRLSDKDANQQSRWLSIYCGGEKGLFTEGQEATTVWMKTGFSAQLIDCLEQRAEQTRPPLLQLLTDLSKSVVWARRLVDDGFVKAIAGLIIDLTPPRENCWTSTHDLVTDALLSAWKSSARSRISYWADDKMLIAIGRLVSFAYAEQERRELGQVLLSVSIPFDEVMELVRHLAAYRGIHAFVARNIDVMINTTGPGFSKGSLNWEYSRYCDSNSMLLCTRPLHIDAGLL